MTSLKHLLTAEQTTAAEQAARVAGVHGLSLMERAGLAVADVCDASVRDGAARNALILCGPGNNGGDGFVAARHLLARGWSVRLHATGEPGQRPTDATEAAAKWSGSVVSLSTIDWSQRADLIVDALFGAGLSRDLDAATHDVVARVNASGSQIVAVDMPTGVDGDTGQERGGSIRATTTVTFGFAKPGHYLYPGAARRGPLVVADIGLAADAATRVGAALWLNEPAAWLPRFPWPGADGHKYGRGHAVVVSGGVSHTGAARLSARAALRVGAGLVTLATPADALVVNAAQLTAVMVRVVEGANGLADLLADPRKNAVVLGPGLGVGDNTRHLVRAALTVSQPPTGHSHTPRSCVLDADALTSFAGDARALAALIADAPGPVVITPHDGEFHRLFANEAVLSPVSKVERTRAAARLLGCVVLLKGADTVVAEPDGRASIASKPAPWLATAGSGDVLSGLIGGLLAQGMPAFEAAEAAAYIHADAGARFGPGLIAEDLPELVPAVLRDLHQASSA